MGSSSITQPPDNEEKHGESPNSREDIVAKLRAELCEDWLPERVPAWGPAKKSGNGFIHSWTDTISHDIESTQHYITCDGHCHGAHCIGRWNRRAREDLSRGLYCIYGSWVTFNGQTISEIKPETLTESICASEGRTLKRLRRLWAEHVLESQVADINSSPQENELDNECSLLSQNELDKVYAMFKKAISKTANVADGNDERKTLGRGKGGWKGITKSGILLKRDTGNRILGDYKDCCDTEPGRYFRRGDLEAWVTWHGWSGLCIRDGRFRPGYHLEVLLFLLATIIDYGGNRQLWRDRELPWHVATEWVWQHTPCDVHQLFTDGVLLDMKELFHREIERLENVLPTNYQPDHGNTREAQYRLQLDRAGEGIARHLAGQPLGSARGYISAWIMIVPNDILDYERDVLCGEPNNFVRGLTSDQQVVDAAYMLLLTIEHATDQMDYDMVDLVLGTVVYYLEYWRYNSSKQYKHYPAVSVRSRTFGKPPETMELLELVQQNYLTARDPVDTYGQLYDRLTAKLAKWYSGCTCDSEPDGHDNWKLLVEALDQGDNEEAEERMQMAMAALCIGASHGDIRCECGLDLACYEGFIRFFHPDTGFVPRMHYRTKTDNANSLAE